MLVIIIINYKIIINIIRNNFINNYHKIKKVSITHTRIKSSKYSSINIYMKSFFK